MKTIKIILLINLAIISLSLTTGCRRNSQVMWEDTKTAGRYMDRGLRCLVGKNYNSRQVYYKDEFYPTQQDESCVVANNYPVGGYYEEYVPLADDPNAQSMTMAEVSRQPVETPGDPGSSIPGIEAFHDPSTNPKLARIFRNIHFAYNSSLLKGQENLETIRDAASYMRQNPNTYVFVEGHCDERGPEAYNLALGSHRSNAVRNLLINEGVSPDNIFTISYGKERPLLLGHDEESWNQNRRAEFKVYQR